MWIEACKEGDLAPGGVKYVRDGDTEVAVCNVEGVHFAVGRRCGHMNAPLEQGPLDGPYLTCPLHHVQFDVRTGEALNNPIDHDYGQTASGTVPAARQGADAARVEDQGATTCRRTRSGCATG